MHTFILHILTSRRISMRFTAMVAVCIISAGISAAETQEPAAAVELARALGTIENQAFAAKLKQSLVASQSRPPTPEREAVIEAWLQEFVNSREWRDAIAQVLTSHLSTEDMVTVAGIFRDPAYHRFEAARPSLNDAMSEALNRMTRERLPELNRRLREVR